MYGPPCCQDGLSVQVNIGPVMTVHKLLNTVQDIAGHIVHHSPQSICPAVCIIQPMQSHGSKKRAREFDDELEDVLTCPTPHATSSSHKRQADVSERLATTQEFTVHRVSCSHRQRYHEQHQSTADYLDIPQLRSRDNRTAALQGRERLFDTESHVEDQSGFTLILNYSCEAYHETLHETFIRTPMPHMDDKIRAAVKPYFHVLLEDGPQASATSETMVLSISLQEALRQLHEQHPKDLAHWHETNELAYPYTQLYRYKHLFNGKSTQTLALPHQAHLAALSGYLTERLTSEYQEAEALFGAGSITQLHWVKLFIAGEMVIVIQDGQPRAFTLLSYPSPVDNSMPLRCWSWDFDGCFFRKISTFENVWPSKTSQTLITDLEVYPLRYATDGLKERLRRRGETFWRCRERNYVSYNVPLQGLGTQVVSSGVFNI
jgi:hypothetical protein